MTDAPGSGPFYDQDSDHGESLLRWQVDPLTGEYVRLYTEAERDAAIEIARADESEKGRVALGRVRRQHSRATRQITVAAAAVVGLATVLSGFSYRRGVQNGVASVPRYTPVPENLAAPPDSQAVEIRDYLVQPVVVLPADGFYSTGVPDGPWTSSISSLAQHWGWCWR